MGNGRGETTKESTHWKVADETGLLKGSTNNAGDDVTGLTARW